MRQKFNVTIGIGYTLDSETTFWHFGNHQTEEQEIEDDGGGLLLEVVR